jgi:hypothetical protein
VDQATPLPTGHVALRHLLVGFDGSRAAHQALRWSAARGVGRRLTVVFVDAPPGWLDGLYVAALAIGGATGPALDASDRVVASMRRAISGLSADVSVTSLVRNGRIDSELARAAELSDATAIVLGSGTDHAIGLGKDVYRRLAPRCTVPVIEVGSPGATARDACVLRATAPLHDAAC